MSPKTIQGSHNVAVANSNSETQAAESAKKEKGSAELNPQVKDTFEPPVNNATSFYDLLISSAKDPAKPTPTAEGYMKYKMEDVVITGYKNGGEPKKPQTSEE